MEFGRLDIEDIDAVDFKLPPDHPSNARILRAVNNDTPSQIFVGCAKWGRKDWIGKIYPPKTKEADFLNHYSQKFNCIELNATFYKMPTTAQTQSWASKVGTDFKFCPKFPNQITHLRRLKNVEELVDRFMKGISGFEKTLGPLFLMPHPQMGPKDLERINTFIEYVPKDVPMFAEVRHPDWYSDPAAFDGLFDVLERHHVGSIITDAAGRRDCVHMRLSTPDIFIRFVGNGLHPSDYMRIDDWVQRIKSWREQGMKTIYFFMHQHEELYSPELCRYLIEQLNFHCQTAIPVPQFVEPINSSSAEPSEVKVIRKAVKAKAEKPDTAAKKAPEKKPVTPRKKKSS